MTGVADAQSMTVLPEVTVYVTRILVFAFTIVIPLSLFAQNPCDWTSQATSIVEMCGRVGVGTTNPVSELHVVHEGDTTSLRGLTIDQVSNDGNGLIFSLRKYRGTAAHPAAVTNGEALASVSSWAHDGSQFLSGGRIRFIVDGAVATGSVPTAMQFMTGINTNGVERMRITSSGNIGIGEANPTQKLVVNGNIVATGSITGATVLGSVYQDLAEWVPSNDDLAPGTVVVLDRAVGNGVKASVTAYDTTVAGVVSAQPGILLGVGDASKEQIATTGRVRVRVDAANGAIEVGDLLVTSGTAGHAMKSQPMDINGRSFHQPGTILGKALEALENGRGEILVLLSLQ